MLATRLIPVLNILNGHIVRSEDFSIHQKIGNVVDEAKRFNEWNADELICLDISREKVYDLGREDHKTQSYHTLSQILHLISQYCSIPLTFGGGIRTMEQVDDLIRNGADKITLNTIATENPEFITEVAKKYGSQAIVVSVDYKLEEGMATVYSNFGTKKISQYPSIPISQYPGIPISQYPSIPISQFVKNLEHLGAGEIFLNSIDRDGKGNGYDIETIGRVVESTKLPVVACGGAGTMDDFLNLAKATKVSGIAAGNIFHFTERAYPKAKKYLKENGINVR